MLNLFQQLRVPTGQEAPSEARVSKCQQTSQTESLRPVSATRHWESETNYNV